CPVRQRWWRQLSVVSAGLSSPCSADGSVTKLVNAIHLSLATYGLSPAPYPCGSSLTPHPCHYLPSRSCCSPLDSGHRMVHNRRCMPKCSRLQFGILECPSVMRAVRSSVALSPQ